MCVCVCVCVLGGALRVLGMGACRLPGYLVLQLFKESDNLASALPDREKPDRTDSGPISAISRSQPTCPGVSGRLSPPHCARGRGYNPGERLGLKIQLQRLSV